jgi:hypothetical protein
MTRSERVAICKNCKKRTFSPKHGAICGLTNSIADFESHCSNFVLDENIYLDELKKKEQELYHPKNFRKKDRYMGSRFLDKRLVNFNPDKKEIVIEKNRTHIFTFYGVTTTASTIIYIYTENYDFIEMLKNPVNLIIWLSMLIYPLIKYILPYPKYTLNSTGIISSKKETIKWDDISAITLTDIDDDRDDDRSSFYIKRYFLRLKNGDVKKLNLINYTISDESYGISVSVINILSKDKQDIIESVIASYYGRFRINNYESTKN